MKSGTIAILFSVLCIFSILPARGEMTIVKFNTGLSRQAQDTLTKKEKRAIRRAEYKAQRAEMYAPVSNPNHADYILLGKSLPRGQSVLEAISGRVPGMMISNNKVVTHGPSSFNGSQEPLMMVDGQEVSLDFGNSIPIEEIDRIEIFIGSSEAMFGSRASRGVISIRRKLTQQ